MPWISAFSFDNEISIQGNWKCCPYSLNMQYGVLVMIFLTPCFSLILTPSG